MISSTNTPASQLLANSKVKSLAVEAAVASLLLASMTATTNEKVGLPDNSLIQLLCQHWGRVECLCLPNSEEVKATLKHRKLGYKHRTHIQLQSIINVLHDYRVVQTS